MEMTDWDESTRALFGLDVSSSPRNARKLVEQGLVKPWLEAKVRNQLKTIATYLYNHQKATPAFQNNVRVLERLLCCRV